MKKSAKDPIREDRIHEEVIVDAHGPGEKATSWYYYLESKITFPFKARCVGSNATSPLSKGETVEVRRLEKEEACESDMLVQITWQDRKLAVSLSQLAAIEPDQSTEQAIGTWHYWVSQGIFFDLRHVCSALPKAHANCEQSDLCFAVARGSVS